MRIILRSATSTRWQCTVNLALGSLGFLVVRKPVPMLRKDPLVRRAVEIFQNQQQKVILLLSTDDLDEMLRLKESSGDPSQLVKSRYGEFMALI